MENGCKHPKYFAVTRGRETGIFFTWEECERQITEYPDAIYEVFSSEEEAQRFLISKRVAIEESSAGTMRVPARWKHVHTQVVGRESYQQPVEGKLPISILQSNARASNQDIPQDPTYPSSKRAEVSPNKRKFDDIIYSEECSDKSDIGTLMKSTQASPSDSMRSKKLCTTPNTSIHNPYAQSKLSQGSNNSKCHTRSNSVRSDSSNVINPYAFTDATPSHNIPVGGKADSSSIVINPYASLERKLHHVTTPSGTDTRGKEKAIKIVAKKLLDDFGAKGEIKSGHTLDPDTARAWGRSVQERFACALLHWSVEDYLVAARNDEKARSQWRTICKLLGLDPPQQAILPEYDNAEAHFCARLTLILEEIRYDIASKLDFHWSRQRSKHGTWKRGPAVVIREARVVRNNEYARHVDMLLSGNDTISSGRGIRSIDFGYLKGGSVYLCVPGGSRIDVTSPLHSSLLYIYEVKQALRDYWFRGLMFEKGILSECFEDPDFSGRGIEFDLYELDIFTATAYDQYYFCYIYGKQRKEGGIQPLYLENQLLGKQFQAPARMAKGPDEDREVFPINAAFEQIKLNKSQKRAADAFLLSPESSITMVQGPPGTGKTTLVASIIANYFKRAGIGVPKSEGGLGQPKLLVCAPTNKAISVLARRFYESVQNWESCNLRTHVYGVELKILFDGFKKKEDNPLYHIFQSTWMTRVIDVYKTIAQLSQEDPHRAQALAEKMHWRLRYSLPHAWKYKGLQALSEDICAMVGSGPIDIDLQIRSMMTALDNLAIGSVWMELMKNSDLVFCTLASAPAIRNAMGCVDDLIIDEAAATTEPTMYLPLYMDPKRMLVVGDPQQLPAVVTSSLATKFGLAESFSERIMHNCKSIDCIMLDTQYRMHHAISAFPSAQFYGGELLNGTNVTDPGFNEGKALLLDSRPFIFIQSNETAFEQIAGRSLQNHGEAEMVVNLVQELRRKRFGTTEWSDPNRLRIITFYNGQVNLLKCMLKAAGFPGVLVGSVDSSQGSEADICIVSFVRNMDTAGFLSDDRRMNVALTRARHQLICIGNVKKMMLLPNDIRARSLRALAKWAYKQKVVLNDRDNDPDVSFLDKDA